MSPRRPKVDRTRERERKYFVYFISPMRYDSDIVDSPPGLSHVVVAKLSKRMWFHVVVVLSKVLKISRAVCASLASGLATCLCCRPLAVLLHRPLAKSSPRWRGRFASGSPSTCDAAVATSRTEAQDSWSAAGVVLCNGCVGPAWLEGLGAAADTL